MRNLVRTGASLFLLISSFSNGIAQNRSIRVGSHYIELVRIPAGTFQMGSPESEHNRRAEHEFQHEVTLTRDYWMATTEVTQNLWREVMGSNPSQNKGVNKPVEMISWEDTQLFIAKLNARTGETFRLPTEAEWEYAARAGSDKPWPDDLNTISWNVSNSGKKSQDVATKKPNPWGLYDMNGNILEMCQDWYTEDLRRYTEDPKGPLSGEKRVLKGGGFTGRLRHLRAADRQSMLPDEAMFFIGFRVAMSTTEG